jgi:hypothetical protein
MRQATLISLPAVSTGSVGKNSAHSVAPSPAPCRSGNAADPPNSAVGGQVEVVTGADDPDAGRWPGPGDVWEEGWDGVRGVASHPAIASTDARPRHHIHQPGRADPAKRIDKKRIDGRYRRSG